MEIRRISSHQSLTIAWSLPSLHRTTKERLPDTNAQVAAVRAGETPVTGM
jgi:hypothetical protein